MMRIGVVICHGKLAFELCHTVERILGQVEGIAPFSNDGLSPETLYVQILSHLQAQKAEEIFLMVDLRGGNCWRIGKMLARQFPHARLLSGVNVPMLVSFLTKREKLGFAELADVVARDAVRGIVLE